MIDLFGRGLENIVLKLNLKSNENDVSFFHGPFLFTKLLMIRMKKLCKNRRSVASYSISLEGYGLS